MSTDGDPTCCASNSTLRRRTVCGFHIQCGCGYTRTDVIHRLPRSFGRAGLATASHPAHARAHPTAGYDNAWTRNVDLTQKLGRPPSVLEPVLNKISLVPVIASVEGPTLPFDQLAVNECPRGVGLSPHIDTHSTLEGFILSLSLGVPYMAKKVDDKRALVYNRYYHSFVEGEPDRLASKVQGARLVDHFYDESKSCIILEKP